MDETPPNNDGTPMEAKPEPPNFRIRFVWLVAAHVVVGVLAGLLPPPDIRSKWQFVCIGCILASQVHLLGIWGGLGATVLWKRLIGVVCGIGYLTALMTHLVGPAIIIDSHVLIGSGTASTVLVMLVVRLFSGSICHESSSTWTTRHRQFSIRRLFVLTTVIAFLVAALKLVYPLVDVTSRETFVGVFIYGTVYAVIAMIPLWCVLASKRPVLYGFYVVAVEAILAFLFGHMLNPDSSADIVAMTFVAIQTAYLAISLLIVRSWGYRLMPMRSRRPVVEGCPK